MSTNPVASTLVKARRGLEQASAQLREGLATLRRAIAEKREQLKAVAEGPMTIEDSLAFIRAEVEQDADLWLREDNGSVAHRFTTATPARRGSIRRGVPWAVKESVPWGARCAAEPEACVAMLLRIVERAGAAAEAGLPLEARPPMIEKLRAELAALEVEEEALVDGLIEAGISVAHRSEVAQRRTHEAGVAEARRAEDALQAARLAALDQKHEQRPRISRSQYLATGGESAA